MTDSDSDRPTIGLPDVEPAPADYCRQIETYLCRKNDGHLIRIVGPAFEQVSGWARRGIPLRIAFRGIDRYFQRYHAKGRRRWPVRIDFCENDVLDLFDEWRRAVGVAAQTTVPAQAEGDDALGTTPPRRAPSLVAHLDRVVTRLSSVLAGTKLPDSLRDSLDRAVRAVDGLRSTARQARGAARRGIVDELGLIERTILDEAVSALDPQSLEELRAASSRELAPFRTRMPDAAYAEALEAALRRQIRECLGLPRIAPE